MQARLLFDWVLLLNVFSFRFIIITIIIIISLKGVVIKISSFSIMYQKMQVKLKILSEIWSKMGFLVPRYRLSGYVLLALCPEATSRALLLQIGRFLAARGHCFGSAGASTKF